VVARKKKEVPRYLGGIIREAEVLAAGMQVARPLGSKWPSITGGSAQ